MRCAYVRRHFPGFCFAEAANRRARRILACYCLLRVSFSLKPLLQMDARSNDLISPVQYFRQIPEIWQIVKWKVPLVFG